jgi:hypothetical protein
MEWGATLPPPSPPHTAPSLPQDAAPLPIESMVGERRLKHPRAEGGPPTDPSMPLFPALVTLDHEGEEDPSVRMGREEMGPAPRPEVQHDLKAPAATVVVSSLGLGESWPPLKMVYTKGCLLSSTRYAYVGCRMPFFVTYQFLYLSLDFNGH